MAAYVCPGPDEAVNAPGCGTLWTPDHDTRPRNPEVCGWAWCPDCQIAIDQN